MKKKKVWKEKETVIEEKGDEQYKPPSSMQFNKRVGGTEQRVKVRVRVMPVVCVATNGVNVCSVTRLAPRGPLC